MTVDILGYKTHFEVKRLLRLISMVRLNIRVNDFRVDIIYYRRQILVYMQSLLHNVFNKKIKTKISILSDLVTLLHISNVWCNNQFISCIILLSIHKYMYIIQVCATAANYRGQMYTYVCIFKTGKLRYNKTLKIFITFIWS